MLHLLFYVFLLFKLGCWYIQLIQPFYFWGSTLKLYCKMACITLNSNPHTSLTYYKHYCCVTPTPAKKLYRPTLKKPRVFSIIQNVGHVNKTILYTAINIGVWTLTLKALRRCIKAHISFSATAASYVSVTPVNTHKWNVTGQSGMLSFIDLSGAGKG